MRVWGLLLLWLAFSGIQHDDVAPAAYARAWVGIDIADAPVTDKLGSARGSGAYVLAVQDGSPASSAGMQIGDVVVAADERPVSIAEDLICAVMARLPATQIVLRIRRGHSDIDVPIVLGQQPPQIVLASALCPTAAIARAATSSAGS